MAAILGDTIANKFKSAVSSTKQAMGAADQQEKGLLAQVDEAVTLTWTQRLIGFSACFGVGLLLSIISIPMLWMLRFTQFGIM